MNIPEQEKKILEFWIKNLELRIEKEAVLRYYFAVEDDFAAAVLGMHENRNIPVDRRIFVSII